MPRGHRTISGGRPGLREADDLADLEPGAVQRWVHRLDRRHADALVRGKGGARVARGYRVGLAGAGPGARRGRRRGTAGDAELIAHAQVAALRVDGPVLAEQVVERDAVRGGDAAARVAA